MLFLYPGVSLYYKLQSNKRFQKKKSIFGFLASDNFNEDLVHVKASFPSHTSNSFDRVEGGFQLHPFPATLNANKYPSALNELGIRRPHCVCVCVCVCEHLGLQLDQPIIPIQLLSVCCAPITVWVKARSANNPYSAVVSVLCFNNSLG